MNELDAAIDKLIDKYNYSSEAVAEFVEFTTGKVGSAPTGGQAQAIYERLIALPARGADVARINLGKAWLGPRPNVTKGQVAPASGDLDPLPMEDEGALEKALGELDRADEAEDLAILGSGAQSALKQATRFAGEVGVLTVDRSDYLLLGLPDDPETRKELATKYVGKLIDQLQTCYASRNDAAAEFSLDQEMAMIQLHKGLSGVGDVIGSMLHNTTLLPLALNVAATLSTRWHLRNLVLIREYASVKWNAERSDDFREVMLILDYALRKKMAKAIKRSLASVPVWGTVQKAGFTVKGLLKAYNLRQLRKNAQGKLAADDVMSARDRAAKRLQVLASAGALASVGKQSGATTVAQLVIATLVDCRIEDGHLNDGAGRYCAAVWADAGWTFIKSKLASM